MRQLLLLFVLLAVAASCNPKSYVYVAVADKLKYGDIADGLPDNDSVVTSYFEYGSIKAVGKYAVTEEGALGKIKVGSWREYYANGKLKSEGNYKIGSYFNCSVGGLFEDYYPYKDGLWKYFDENGDLKYEVEFVPTELHVHTSCEGGDTVVFGLIKTIPLKYLEVLTADIIYELQKVEISEEFQTTSYTPLNGELYIR